MRNPLDTLFSYWQFNKAYEAAKDKTSEKIHMARINVTLGETDEQVAEVKLFATRWLEFNELWHNVAMPVQLLRYEDLRTEPLSLLMKLVQFILPEEEQPSLQRLSCALELDEAHQAYQSELPLLFF